MEVKPGMPTIGALYQDKVMICLSGNPYGAAVNLELIARTVLAKMPGGPLYACFLPGWACLCGKWLQCVGYHQQFKRLQLPDRDSGRNF